MRTYPNYTRLRFVAIFCWIISSWLILQSAQIQYFTQPLLLPVAQTLASLLILAVGIAFWQLATDPQAGVVLDKKGMMLNLGHYAAFIDWDNVAEIGVSHHRSSLLSLGSARQLGIRLQEPAPVIQSYEERLPASRGPLGAALRHLHRVLQPLNNSDPDAWGSHLAHTRARTGYDILIPEAILGQKIDMFIATARSFQHPVRRYESQPDLLPARSEPRAAWSQMGGSAQL